MLRSSTARIAAFTIAALVALALLRYRPWQRVAATNPQGAAGKLTTASDGLDGARQKLTVGFLPVT